MKARALTPTPLPVGEGRRTLTPTPLPEGEGRSGAHPFSLGEKVARDSGSDEGVAALDWPAIERELDAYGCAIAPKLISRETCREIAALYPDDARFRSRIVMAAHGFGRGEYKYFADPLPELDRRASPRPLSAARPDRRPVERGDGRFRPLSRGARSVPQALP